MSNDRLTRVNELLRREISQLLYRIVHNRDFDMSAVTITRVDVAPNLRHAKVYVSVRDHQDDRESMLSILRAHRHEFQHGISTSMNLKYTPKLRFELDDSLELGDSILDLLSGLEEPPAKQDSHE
jgi:ribosome-binding factor A